MNSETNPKVILVCDDDADARMIVIQALAPEGYEILVAESGDEAREICKKRLPDTIVMDVMMPGLTGTQFVSWLRAEVPDPYIPVLLLTALTDTDSIVSGLDLGADEYLTKPYRYRELQARVRALVRIKQLTEDLRRRGEELQASNQQLIQTQSQLIARERELAIAQMAGTAAHNLGQPLTTVLLHLELLGRTLTGEQSAQQHIRAIESGCSEIRELLARLQQVNPQETEPYLGNDRLLKLPKEQQQDR